MIRRKNEPEEVVLINRRKTLDHLKKRLVETALNNIGYNEDVYLEIADYRIETWVNEVPPSQSVKCSDILDELKADDYYNYIHTGYSRFSEDDWDYLIRSAKEKEKLHEDT